MCNRCACFLDSKSIFERKQHGEDDEDDVNDDVNDVVNEEEALASLVFGRALTDSLSLSREEEEEEAFIKWSFFCVRRRKSRFGPEKKKGLLVVFFFKAGCFLGGGDTLNRRGVFLCGLLLRYCFPINGVKVLSAR